MKTTMISPAEAELMKVLWSHAEPMTLNELNAAVRTATAWSKNTVSTMLTRLMEKGAVSRSGTCRSYRFAAAVDERRSKAEAVEKLSRQYFAGSLGSMLSFFAESRQLTPEDIRALQETLAKLEKKQ